MRTAMVRFSILLAMIFAVPVASHAQGGSDNPFPLDLPLPFPWGTIEGMWKVESSDYSAQFVFDVALTCEHRQILKVKHINPENGEVLAEGIGYMPTNDPTIVYAAMKGLGGNYVLIVGAYNERVGLDLVRFFGLRIFPFNDLYDETRYRISKMSNRLPMEYLPGHPALRNVCTSEVD